MTTLPPDFQILSEASSTRIILPTRLRTSSRFVGCIPMAFGLVFCIVPILVLVNMHGWNHIVPPAGPEGHVSAHGFGWSNLIMLLFMIPFFVVGVMPIFLGLLIILPGHAEIHITDEQLIAVNKSGPFRFLRRTPSAGITSIRLENKSNGVQVTGQPTECLVAETRDASALQLARRYPREQLTVLATYLVEELNRRNFGAVLHSNIAPQNITVAIDPPAAPVVPDRVPEIEPPPAQPAGSKIVFVATPESLTFAVPRTGFRGVAIFFLFFSLIWDGISFPLFGIMIYEFIRNPSLEHLLPVGFLLIFVLIGVAMALAAIQTAFRKAVILATRDTLVYTQSGPIRNVEYQWKPSDLASIRSDYSGTTVNDRRLRELQIHTSTGVKHGFMDGRDDAELAWFAAALRAFYGMSQ